MKQLCHQIMEHIKEHPPDYGNSDSILEMLFTTYHQYNQMDTKEIKRDFDRLYTDMTGLSLREMVPLSTRCAVWFPVIRNPDLLMASKSDS